MASLNPKEVFEDYAKFLPQLTVADDAAIEGQYFDRKEACKPDSSGSVSKGQLSGLREQITECISAFANTNQLGGLIVVGVGKEGKVYGINHLSDYQRNNLTNVQQVLRNHAAQVKFVDCTDHDSKRHTDGRGPSAPAWSH
jgi:hypothetical protein